MPKLSTLIAVAGGLGIGIGVMTVLLRKETQKFAKHAAFVEKAVEIMKNQPQVKQLLGESVQIGQATFQDGWGKFDRNQVRLRIPVKGENDNAYLFAYARKKHKMDKFRLFKLEATFGKIEGKKLVLLDRTDEEDDNEEENLPAKNDKSDSKPKLSAKEVMKSWK